MATGPAPPSTAPRLERLDAEFHAGLADCDRQVVVTGHQAFGYLARRYNLEQVAIAGLSPDAEPDPDRLAELTDLVRKRGVTTIFTEELVSPKVAETLAREAGVTTAVLHTIEGLESEGEPGADYFSLMPRQPGCAAPGPRVPLSLAHRARPGTARWP